MFTGRKVYIQTRKTVITRKFLKLLLCCKKKTNRLCEAKPQARILILVCGFVASLCVLIFALIGCNTTNIPEIFQVLTLLRFASLTVTICI